MTGELLRLSFRSINNCVDPIKAKLDCLESRQIADHMVIASCLISGLGCALVVQIKQR
jgi:hypothetical protein